MPEIVRRSRKALTLPGSLLFGIAAFSATITLKHLMDTPQPLESVLPGEAQLYRWRARHVFYKVLGTPENPPIVLLHHPGIGASAYEMRYIMAKLAEHYYVFAPDLPGFGLSDRFNLDYTVETYTNFCVDFLTEVVQTGYNEPHPVTLLASGLSCNYAIAVAHDFPDMCERLVLISPVALSGNRPFSALMSSLLRLPMFGLSLYTVCSTRFGLRWQLTRRNPQYRGKQGEPKKQRRHSKADVDYLYAATHRFGAEHAPLALWSGNMSRDVRHQFESLQQPVLVIWGAQALHDSNAEGDEQHMPEQAQLVIMRDAGICVHEQYPEVVITDILDWHVMNSNSTTI